MTPANRPALARHLCVLALLALLSTTCTAQSFDLAAAERTARTITIYRDTFGVPHIFGPTDAACVFGLMYAQAEDNFWQLEQDYIRDLVRLDQLGKVQHGER